MIDPPVRQRHARLAPHHAHHQKTDDMMWREPQQQIRVRDEVTSEADTCEVPAVPMPRSIEKATARVSEKFSKRQVVVDAGVSTRGSMYSRGISR